MSLPTREINVYTDLVVVWPGETFNWVTRSGEGSVTVNQGSVAWPLDHTSYSVSSGTQASATVSGAGTGSFSFSCNPPARNFTEQAIFVVSNPPYDVCDDITVAPGDYFFWQNPTSQPITITPADENPDFWPLEQQGLIIPPNGYYCVRVPAEAQETDDEGYALTVSAGCPSATQPIIKVFSGL